MEEEVSDKSTAENGPDEERIEGHDDEHQIERHCHVESVECGPSELDRDGKMTGPSARAQGDGGPTAFHESIGWVHRGRGSVIVHPESGVTREGTCRDSLDAIGGTRTPSRGETLSTVS